MMVASRRWAGRRAIGLLTVLSIASPAETTRTRSPFDVEIARLQADLRSLAAGLSRSASNSGVVAIRYTGLFLDP